MSNFFSKFFCKFRSEQDGTLSVEAVFAFPLLIWAATATYTFFDAYKAQNASFRANYTISDILSRETESVDLAYLNGLMTVFRFMTFGDAATSWIRVSLVQCTADCTDEASRDLEFDWSHGANGAPSLLAADFDVYGSKIPLFPIGDKLILVETSLDYTPPFANMLVSFPERKLVSHVVTRPRFGPQLLWSGPGANGIDEEDFE
ncbi:MAG: pilus assembly protein [Marinosulfonomonas sp.]|nr:pilus assembly protein [Marinosulfonomonas sp.]